jgi:hypothetical protein
LNSPNIFSHATSELSQDAFIKWLLEHLNNTFQEQSAKAVAEKLLEEIIKRYIKMYSQHEKELSNWHDYQVEIVKKSQADNIDVLALFKDNKLNKFAILIEDKIKANESRKEQIEYYMNKLKEKDEYRNLIIIPVYFKSSYMLQSEKNDFKSRKIVTVNYRDIYNIFSNVPISVTSNVVLFSWWTHFLEKYYTPIKEAKSYVRSTISPSLTLKDLKIHLLRHQQNNIMKEVMFERITSYLFRNSPLSQQMNIEWKPGRTLYEYLIFKKSWREDEDCHLSFYFAWNYSGTFSFDMKTVTKYTYGQMEKDASLKKKFTEYRKFIRSSLQKNPKVLLYGKIIDHDLTKKNRKLQIFIFPKSLKTILTLRQELNQAINDVSYALKNIK